MKSVSVLATLCLLVSIAQAQSFTCGGTALPVTIAPADPCPGETITVTLTNTSGQIITFFTECLFQKVRQKKCPNGTAVYSPPCQAVPTTLTPGKSISQTWDQKDNGGQQVAPGNYLFEIFFDVGGSAIDQCCVPITLQPPCCVAENYGPAGSGSGGYDPVLTTAGGMPQTGNLGFQLAVQNGLGGAQSMLFVGLAPASVTAGWGVFLVNPGPPLLQLPFALSGPFGAAGQGAITIPAPVPDVPAFVGLSVYLQALIADPGSDGNISHTPGLKLTIC